MGVTSSQRNKSQTAETKVSYTQNKGRTHQMGEQHGRSDRGRPPEDRNPNRESRDDWAYEPDKGNGRTDQLLGSFASRSGSLVSVTQKARIKLQRKILVVITREQGSYLENSWRGKCNDGRVLLRPGTPPGMENPPGS